MQLTDVLSCLNLKTLDPAKTFDLMEETSIQSKSGSNEEDASVSCTPCYVSVPLLDTKALTLLPKKELNTSYGTSEDESFPDSESYSSDEENHPSIGPQYQVDIAKALAITETEEDEKLKMGTLVWDPNLLPEADVNTFLEKMQLDGDPDFGLSDLDDEDELRNSFVKIQKKKHYHTRRNLKSSSQTQL